MAILCEKKLINYQCKGFKPAEGCYIKHVSDPLGYDIVLNSEPLATRLAQRREINSGFATNRSHRQALAGTSRANIIANRGVDSTSSSSHSSSQSSTDPGSSQASSTSAPSSIGSARNVVIAPNGVELDGNSAVNIMVWLKVTGVSNVLFLQLI